MPDEANATEGKMGSSHESSSHKSSSLKTWSAVARRSRVPLGFACALLYFWFARPTRFSLLLGSLTLIPGLVIRGLASGHVRKNEELATSGPYAYSRNPLYLGSLILAFGFMLAAQSWWVVAILLTMFLAIYLPVIQGEEAFLRERFPGYEAYAAHVPRLLPTLRPFTDSQVRFSWDLYRKHREYNALIGAAAMTALLMVKTFWPRK